MRDVVLITAALLGFAASCHAQWSLGAYVGAAHTRPAELEISQRDGTRLTFPNVPFEGKSFAAPIYYGYRIGRRICGLFGIEAEVIHAKAYADLNRAAPGSGRAANQQVAGVPIADYLRHFAMSHGLNFLFVNAVVTWPVQGSRVKLTGRSGIGPVIPHGEIETPEGRSSAYHFGGVGLQAAGGFELRLQRRVYWSAEYKFTYGRPRVVVPGGEVNVTTRSHHIAAGITIRTGR